MGRIPIPPLTFTIPSLHDDTTLECRIYNLQPKSQTETTWCTKGAIIAHPYAPLGGCYDDPVVLLLVQEILQADIVVGTFNFRGANSSTSHTSWTGKPELQDYLSFIGLFAHYLHFLRINPSSLPITLILGGYSYGSLITSHLPTWPELLAPLAHPEPGDAASEILLRAQHLAEQWHRERSERVSPDTGARGGSDGSQKKSRETDGLKAPGTTIAMGGDESPGRRISHDGKRSLDVVRKGVDRSRRKLNMKRGEAKGSVSVGAGAERGLRFELNIAYLLISPLMPPLSSVLAVGLAGSLVFSSSQNRSVDEKLIRNDTLVAYGDGDAFSSQRKLRRWAEGLRGSEGSMFRFHEIAGAGHFWRDEGVADDLREVVQEWIRHVII